MEFWQFLGDLHPKLVQFPLVLLLMGLAFDAIGLVRRSDAFHWAAKILSGVGTFFLLFAFICGIYAEVWAGRAGIPQEQIEWHELMANIASWGFVVLAAWRMLLTADRRKSLAVYTVIGLCWYVLLGITGYLGGRLVFDYGTAVVGARANNILSLHDLNVLATRQTDENLRYSEMMHHIFGWLTLALSGSLFAHALFPKKGDKLKWVGPILLLLGGIFLFFRADADLYPNFFDMRQLRDREVQLHKTLAIILIVVGAVGLRKSKKPAAAHEEDQAAASGRLSTPSKVVAVMALIGGGMLFTHVHTVAPYANVAAGVYVAHVVMGLTALGIGITRLLQDGMPTFRHAFAVAFAVLMCFESVLLITYNEGLPWYIGYGTYDRWGWDPVKNEIARDKPIAPFGPLRAELSFDEKTQKMDVLVLDRAKYQRVNIPANPVQLLISRGYQETAIELDPVDPADNTCSHFSAYAPSLKNVPAFSARLALPVNGTMKMGYFDPWVTPVIQPIPPNEVATYQCPMHDGILTDDLKKCPVCPLCGMPMIPIQRAVRATLHDLGFHMDFTAAPDPAKPGPLNFVMTFTPRRDGQLIHLAVVHEHPLHLIIVSHDLSTFDHVHPIPQPDGSLRLEYSFARPGNYLLFADTTPEGERSQVFRFPLAVGNPPAEDPDQPALLTPTAAASKPLSQDPTMTADLIFQPRTPSAGLHTNFLFRLTKDGQPVTNLEPLMAAMGHCVIISEDTQTYLHCHPEQLYNPTPDARGGPEVSFHTIFPKAGRYKIWGQFKRGDQIIVADFVVDIKEPILPPKVINFLLDD